MKKKVVIDCDPGIDDALALAVAFASDNLDVLGITTVAGNVDAGRTARNALALCELMGQGCPVARGAEAPLSGNNRHAGHVHGKNGLGNVILSSKGKLSSLESADLLYQIMTGSAGDVEIIALGPLTNLALLLEKYPGIQDRIPKISLMGGSLEKGNVTAHAEFNFYADSLAADRVLRSGIPIDMYGLDVTNKAAFDEERVEELQNLGGPVLASLCSMMGYYQDFYKAMGHRAMKLHDPLAVIGSFSPDLTEMKAMTLGVETRDHEKRGKVVTLDASTGPVNVALKHNQDAFISSFCRLMGYWS